ncbi:MAG: peptidase M23 [Cycloclasticus sp.]|nr:MAG: peptidase M23 [Cycloclasticus sp.]
MLRQLLSLCLVFLMTPSFALPEEDSQKQLTLLRERMQIVEHNIAKTQRNKTKEEKDLRRIEKRLSESSKKLRSLNGKLLTAQNKIKTLQQQQMKLKVGIEEQKGFLAEQLQSAYLMGKQQRVKMLLNQESPDRMSRVMQYYDYFNQARIDSVKAIEVDILALKTVEEQLLNEKRELASFVDAKRVENKTLIASKQSRKVILAILNKQITSSGQELSALKENEKRLTNLLASIRQAINDIPILSKKDKSFVSLKGKLPWPIKGQLKKKFGSARKSGRYDGVLISAREGSAIGSISHGRVVYADWLRGYGLLIIVDHGSTYLSLYAFNESLYKEVGDWVETGETLATIGVSGGQQKAGLYFSIRKNGKPVNPVHWCRATRKGRVG